MCCRNFWKRIIPFAIALAIGLLAANISQKKEVVNETQKELKPIIKVEKIEEGTGRSGACFGTNSENREFAANYFEKLKNNNTSNLKIISKPRPKYTDLAGQNYVQGNVVLRVTFLANKQIGEISTITSLPYGLTEEAINAAKMIKFEPAMKRGKVIAVRKTVSYNFTIY